MSKNPTLMYKKQQSTVDSRATSTINFKNKDSPKAPISNSKTTFGEILRKTIQKSFSTEKFLLFLKKLMD